MSKEAIKELKQIPGVGDNIAQHLLDAGVTSIAQLKNADPDRLYAKSCHAAGVQIDRCLLYVYRCAVYFASHKRHDPEKLKWWNWKDQRPDGDSGAARRSRRRPRH
ncbi:MAG TPA: helix-hairpin-helix domain-containing protein [candidate division Zixibacteria bacterium]|nr:helix-hairpin-helix domain-containing protein [candidate division Zixibacteria bacterium]